MAKKIKLEKEMVSRLAGIGVNASDEATAKEQVLEILKQNGIDGMDDESLDTLIEIAESFVDPDEVDSDDEEADEEPEDDEPEAEDDEPEAEDDEPEAEDDEPEAEDDEPEAEEEDEKPAKKQPKKVAKKAAEVQKPAKVEAKKPAKKVEKKSAKGVKIDPKNNESDRKYFKVFDEVLPKDEYERTWLASSGVNFKHIGKNGKLGVALFEQCSLQDDGKIIGTLHLHKRAIETLEENDIEYKLYANISPFVKKIEINEAVKIVELVIDSIVAEAKKKDKKLGDNRKKMEEKMKEQAKPVVKSVVAKAAEVQKPANVKKVVLKKSAKK